MSKAQHIPMIGLYKNSHACTFESKSLYDGTTNNEVVLLDVFAKQCHSQNKMNCSFLKLDA